MTPSSGNGSDTPPALSVAIVGICSAGHLRRCLEALDSQEGAPYFETVVAYDPAIEGIDEVGNDYARVRLVCNLGQRTPLELASLAIRESRGAVVLLTEDHCIPSPDWVAKLSGSLTDDCGAAGGVVELAEGTTAVDWAFYFVDFFRYSDPVEAGESPTLTVCNVAYRRSDLDAVADAWDDIFHETVVNNSLRRRIGPLCLGPGPRVMMRRHVRFRDALVERYVFGRLFGCSRLERTQGPMRVAYKLFAPVLPVLLLGRMFRKAIGSSRHRWQLISGCVPLTLMVLAWSWGEWLGYLTETRPRDLTVAAEQKED